MTTIPGHGALVAGAYRLDGILLRTAHQMIVAATHAQLGTRVVLELAWPTHINSSTVQRFLRDARAASQLQSRHIARVLDAGALDDGGFYVATEYIEGEELQHHLALRGSLPIHEAASVVVQVCEAVAEAHANDIIHRDLSLANVLVTHGGVKLVGIARMSSLIRAPHADARTDVFALGRMLFELVTGASPFATGVGLLRQRAHLPHAFVSIVERCLDPEAARRFSRVWDLASALSVFTAQQVHREAPAFTAANVVAVEADRVR